MKNVSDSLQAQWQENKQQLNNLLEQQERIFTDLLRYSQQTATHSHDFFVKDDYVRIVVEIKARELLGELWPGKWHSMPMLADMLTPIVGWIVYLLIRRVGGSKHYECTDYVAVIQYKIIATELYIFGHQFCGRVVISPLIRVTRCPHFLSCHSIYLFQLRQIRYFRFPYCVHSHMFLQLPLQRYCFFT